MGIFSTYIRQNIYKIYNGMIKKNGVFNLYKLYNQSQFWSRDKLSLYQMELFKNLWKNSINHVPYYCELARKCGIGNNDIESIDDLRKIPFLTKDIARENFDKLKATNMPAKRFIKNSTSGSTGSNFHFFNDTNEGPVYNALELRKYDMLGGSFFDRELIIWGAAFDVKSRENQRLSKIKDWYRNKKVLSGYNLSDNDLLDIYNTMKSYKPAIIKSYPSILMTLCAYFRKKNLVYKPKYIHIGGEKLFDFQRKEIEKTFCCPVYDFYGARDMSQIAVNCQEKTGLHVFMENVIVEIVDDEGNNIENGEGDLVITDLHNYVMPFIRYRIGDRARVSQNRKCKCNRGLQLIDEVVGRTFEIIQFPNGNRVGGTFWTLVMRSVPGIKDFQVIQEKHDTIKINFTTIYNNDVNIDIIKNNIHSYSGNDLKIEFNREENIAVTKSGKMQFVISKVK